MDRRQLLGALGGGVLGGWSAALRADEPASPLTRFARIDWQQFAVMTKPFGAEPPWRLRLEAEHEAARSGAGALPELLRYTEHASPHVRAFAAQMLGVIGEPQAGERLRALLARDAEAIVRSYAVEALSRLTSAGKDPAVGTAIAAARHDANGNVRFSAQQAALRVEKKVPGGESLRRQWTQGFDPEQLPSARLDRPAPAFELTADSGLTIRLRDYRRRRPVVLLFQLADW
jgi:HEAT repeat protein